MDHLKYVLAIKNARATHVFFRSPVWKSSLTHLITVGYCFQKLAINVSVVEIVSHALGMGMGSCVGGTWGSHSSLFLKFNYTFTCKCFRSYSLYHFKMRYHWFMFQKCVGGWSGTYNSLYIFKMGSLWFAFIPFVIKSSDSLFFGCIFCYLIFPCQVFFTHFSAISFFLE